jgi:hypothetical protein
MGKLGIRKMIVGAAASVNTVLGSKRGRTASILVGLLAAPAPVLAQALPTTPPAGYDQGGRYPAGTIQWNVSYYSSVAGRKVTRRPKNTG